MRVFHDLGNAGFAGGWLKRSRMLALAIKPLLEASVVINRRYLRTFPQTPPLYRAGVVYQNEPPEQGFEDFAVIPAMLKRGWGDCFPEGTLVLREGQLVPVESLEVGDRIWGLDDWSMVEAIAPKGELAVTAIDLNNGSTLHLTEDHHVYVLECAKHGVDRARKCTPKCCPLEERREQRVRVSELRQGMVLAQPKSIGFGAANPGLDVASLMGLYLSDGWSEAGKRFCISGLDGHVKEAQKRHVEQISKRLGVATRWHRKYIAVNDGELATLMASMGKLAPEKHLHRLDFEPECARVLLDGIMADSGANTNGGRTFTTTSRELAIQTRVLHRMFGVGCSWRQIENHGGLGKHPIYRLGVRAPATKSEKVLRIKSIEREVATLPVWDIQTSDNRVYLPEHDVTVSQCDDLGPWRVAELQERGENASIRIQWKKIPGKGKLYHIVVRRGDGRVEDPSRILGMGNPRLQAKIIASRKALAAGNRWVL